MERASLGPRGERASGCGERRRSVRHRRRIALGVLFGLAAGAFAFGAALGDDGAAPPPSVVSQLALPQLAGERLLAGVSGTAVSPKLRAMVRHGAIAGVVLFADNFPTRAAGCRLIAELQGIPRPPGLRAPLLVMTDQEGER